MPAARPKSSKSTLPPPAAQLSPEKKPKTGYLTYADIPAGIPDPTGDPNMVGIKDKTGKVHWANRNDIESIEWAANQGGLGPLGLPPSLAEGTTPNPLANVNPNPAGNRNTAIPKTGAVLPFPNPNQAQADLAAPGGAGKMGLASPLPPLVNDVTAGEVAGAGAPASSGDLYAPGEENETRIIGGRPFRFKGGKWSPIAGGGGTQQQDFRPPSAPGQPTGGTTTTPPAGQPTDVGSTTTTQPEEEIEPELKSVLDRAIQGKNTSGPNFEALLLAYQRTHKGADLNKIRAQAAAYMSAQQAATARGEEAKVEVAALEATLRKMFPEALLKNQKLPQVLANLTPESIDSALNAGKITPDEYLKLQDSWKRFHPGEEFPESVKGTPADELSKQKAIISGKSTVVAGGPTAAATPEQTAAYRQALKGFSQVPTTLEEATAWLQQTLTPPPGFRQDPTTKEWLDANDNPAEGDSLSALQEYEFQKEQYAENRKRADAIVKSYADLDTAQRGRDAADAALQKALGTKDVMEQVELTYLLEKAELALKEATKKNQMVQTFVSLTNNPAMAARLKALGLLDQFNKDTGMDLKVPDRVPKEKVFAMIPSLGDWANMNPQQQMDALEMLSAKTGWLPEELAALMSETAGAPGGGRGGVSESTVKRQ